MFLHLFGALQLTVLRRQGSAKVFIELALDHSRLVLERHRSESGEREAAAQDEAREDVAVLVSSSSCADI